jgi:hypothetical protein
MSPNACKLRHTFCVELTPTPMLMPVRLPWIPPLVELRHGSPWLLWCKGYSRSSAVVLVRSNRRRARPLACRPHSAAAARRRSAAVPQCSHAARPSLR